MGRVKIESYKAITTWHWNVENETLCGICQHPFEGCCPKCLFPGDSCPLLSGSCKHSFHMHCIMRWLQEQAEHSTPQCPLCRQEWKE